MYILELTVKSEELWDIIHSNYELPNILEVFSLVEKILIFLTDDETFYYDLALAYELLRRWQFILFDKYDCVFSYNLR